MPKKGSGHPGQTDISLLWKQIIRYTYSWEFYHGFELLQINKLEKELEEKTQLFRILKAFLDIVENILKDKVRNAWPGSPVGCVYNRYSGGVQE